MKTHLLVYFCLPLILLLSPRQGYAQREIIPVDWDGLKALVKKDPDHVKELIKTLSAPTIDKDFPYRDRIIAFYGQSLLTEDSEEYLVEEMEDLRAEGKWSEVLSKAEAILKINPLNIDALYEAAISINKLRGEGNTTRTHEEGQIYYNRMMRLFNVIAYTGYGNRKYPFYVTKVSDEYNFLRHYLNIWEYSGQSLVDNCDLIKLNESSEYYSSPEIYFEASRPLEIETAALFF